MARQIHTPHDRFMKSFLSDIEVAREYFEEFLPESLRAIINLDGLQHSGTSFISEVEEGAFLADLVFECPLHTKEEKLYLSILVEHKSFKNKYVYIQLGRYLFGAYSQQLKEKKGSLIPVIPFLYYHGGVEWTPEELRLFFPDYPEIVLDYIPAFDIIFRNISDYTEEDLLKLGNTLLASALMTQKYSHDPEQLLGRITTIFSTLESWIGRNLIDDLIVYFVELIELEEEELDLIIDKIPEMMKTAFVSTADKIRQKGWMEGKVEGKVEGKAEGVRNMLIEGMEVTFICRMLGVSPEFVEKIRKDIQS